MTRQVIITGNCLDVLARIRQQSVDVVVTSPPYNLDVKYSSYNDSMPVGDYLANMIEVFTLVKRVMKPDASLFLIIAGSNLRPWLPLEVALMLREHFVLQNRITWLKSNMTPNGSSGQFKPINSDRFLAPTTEDIFHLTIKGDVKLDRLAIGVPYTDKTNLKRHNKSQADPTVPKPDLRDPGNAWFIPYQTVQSHAEKHDHPAGFPVELPQRCIRLHGKPNAVVLDPFMGTGTTLLAAHLDGHRGIGIELDPGYCSTAQRRLEAAGAAVNIINGSKRSAA